MAKIVDFVIIFDDGVRKRHYHETERGKVVYFAVQLELYSARQQMALF